jgi:hypothetical protein
MDVLMASWSRPAAGLLDGEDPNTCICRAGAVTLSTLLFASINRQRRINMEHAQLIQAAASIAGGMAAAHYDKFSGLVATRITDIAETAVKIARAIEVEARKQP